MLPLMAAEDPLTLTWNNKRFDWVNVVYFGVIHAAALLAPWTFTWTGLGVLLFLYWLSCSAGICMGFHRLLTHRSFTVSKPVEYLITTFGMLTSEGGAISWVAMHRLHHQLSDREGQDLHTPKDGFWWSHWGWIFCDLGMDRREMERKYAPELVADRFQNVMNRIHVLPNILVGIACYAWGGWPLVIWGTFLRIVVGVHATWLVNSAAHTFGYRTYDTPEGSKNCWWVGLVAWGEGWHNNHHAFQRSARHGLEWWEFDATWMLIRALSAVGIARDIRLVPQNADSFRLDRRAGTESVEAAA